MPESCKRNLRDAASFFGLRHLSRRHNSIPHIAANLPCLVGPLRVPASPCKMMTLMDGEASGDREWIEFTAERTLNAAFAVLSVHSSPHFPQSCPRDKVK